MCDILFGESYYLRFDPKLWEAMQPFPPLGTMYAASFMRSRGYQVALFDAMLAETEAEWEQALIAQMPRFAVIYEDNFNYLSKMCLLRMRQAAFTMIAMARQYGCQVIVCGADASDHPDDYLSQGADFVLIGEGEHSLGELVDHLSGRSDTPLDTILGLTREGCKRTTRRPDIRDLDALPFPAWDLIDVPRYRQLWLERHGYFAMNMVTTRGCPFHCNWCAKPIWGQRYNVRSPENVVAELKWLKETYHPDIIWFVDDIFGLKPGWVPSFGRLVDLEGLHVPFRCLSRVDLLLREGEIAALKQAGARIIWVGAESGAQKILDAMDKGTRVEQIYEVARRLHAANLKVGFFLQFGYPGETLQDIEKTLQIVRDCEPDDIGVSVSYPLPGTKFFAAVKEQLGSRQNWYDSDDLAMLYQGPFSTEFYRQLHTFLHCEFRLRKASRALRGNQVSRGTDPIPGSRRQQTWSRTLVKLLYYWIRLPVERWKLNSLARLSHQDLSVLPQALRPEDAAQPSPQTE